MDPISDMLTRIRNAQAVGKERVSLPFSQLKFRIAAILAQAGYLTGVERRTEKTRRSEVQVLDLVLKYDDGLGAISGIRLISRPSRHLYIGAKDIKPVQSGFGFAVISTPQGVMKSTDARKANVGGEVLFEIW